MSLLLRISVGLTSVVSVLLGFAVPNRAARACTLPSCAQSYAAPAAYKSIPVNAPALVFRPGNSSALDVTGVSKVAFFDVAGTALALDQKADPAASGHFLLTPKEPLVAGNWYRLVNLSWCSGPATWPAESAFNNAFSVTPAMPLPTAIGPVSVTPFVGDVDLPDSGACTKPGKVGAALFTVNHGPEMSAYLWLARWTLKVDGKVEVVSRYGDYDALSPFPSAARRINFPYLVCDANRGSWLSAGKHTAELSVHIAGATQDPPPVTFPFELSCTASEPSDGGIDGDPSPADGDGGSGPSSFHAGPAGSSPGSACSYGDGGPGSGWGVLAALLAFVVVRLTSRRARRGVR
jgi:hypothetical protein